MGLWGCFDAASIFLSLASTTGIWVLILISYLEGVSGVWLSFGIPAVSILNFTFYFVAMVQFVQKHLGSGHKKLSLLIVCPFFWCLPVIMYFGYAGTFSRLYEKLGFRFRLESNQGQTRAWEEWERRYHSQAWILWESAPQMLTLLILLSTHVVLPDMATSQLVEALQMAVILTILSALSFKVFLESHAAESLQIVYLFIAQVWAVVLVVCAFGWVAAYMHQRVNSWVWLWLILFGIAEASVCAHSRRPPQVRANFATHKMLR